jgi:biopolymer transport protein ExbD
LSAAVDSEGLDVNLTPLLDLVLQLIMFFMITVNFVRVDQFDDSISLPLSSQAVMMPSDNTAEDWIFLNMDGDGKLVGALKNERLDTPGKLKAHLERAKESLERSAKARGKTGEIKIVVILRADKECLNEDIWSCLYSCQRAGFKHWQLRAMTENK